MAADFDIFPTLDEPAAQAVAVAKAAPAAPAVAVTSVKAAVLSQFKATEPVLQALVARYANVAIDVSTPKGLADAKAARHDLRKNGRFVVQNARDDLKAEINALKPVIESEAERLIAMVKPTEDAYDGPITEREAQLAAEKAEREAKEAARVAVHRAGIAKIAGYVTQAQGKTSEQILAVINGVSAYPILPEQWEEFAAGAEIQKAETLEALQALFHATKTAEDEAAAREAQRIENECAAAALAEERRQIQAERAELKRQADELAAAKKAEADRVEAAAQAQRDAEAKAVADAEAAQRQAAEDEANRLAQEAAAEALQHTADATPADVIADAYAPEQLNDDALAAMPPIADEVPAVTAPAEPEQSAHHTTLVSTGILHPTPGPVTFAEPEPAEPAPLAALLDHIAAAFDTKFASHPKPSPAWWGELRRLSDEAREFVAA